MNRLPKYPKFGKGDQARRISGIAARGGIDLSSFSDRSVVIAGSNGKGSTAAMLASILSETGRKTGLFTSPHLFEVNERFAIDRAQIGDEALDAHWRRIEAAADAWLAENEGEALGGFEFLFLIAASWFAEQGCDFIVWEAGIGGRYDVTRLVEPRIAAVVSLDLEHTKLLGDTLDAIALDKMDVVAPGGSVFFGPDAAPFAEAINRHARERGVAPAFLGAEEFGGEAPLAGAHQRVNADLAARLAEEIVGASREDIQSGLAATRWPGRLETISTDPHIVIDVGHTPAAIEAALAGFRVMHGETNNVLVCGASVDKDASQIITRLAPGFATIICAAALHKGAPADEIAALAFTANSGAVLFEARSMREAHALAVGHARVRKGAVYVAGGLFLAVEFKAHHEGRDPAALAFF